VCAPPFKKPEGLSPHSQEPVINSFSKQMNPVRIIKPHFFIIIVVVVIIIIIGSTALGGLWPPQAKSPGTSIPGSRHPVSATQFPCIFLYPALNP
jgi:hypothetical protein